MSKAVIRGDAVTKFDAGDGFMQGIATPRQGTSEISVWRARIGAGEATPPHYHDREKVTVIVSGSGFIRWPGRKDAVSAGDAIIEAPNAVHQLIAGSEGPLEAVGAMPCGTRSFLPDGVEMDLPWAD